jgi:hypothetical protein
MHDESSHLCAAAMVMKAAALLETDEFTLFRVAYVNWYGQNPELRRLEDRFADYMLHSTVPFWVCHLAREILEKSRSGELRPVDYGIPEQRVSPRLLLQGRRYAMVLLLVILALTCAALGYEDLLQVVGNCYFPPCY